MIQANYTKLNLAIVTESKILTELILFVRL